MSIECYCGSSQAFNVCCQPYVLRRALPELPEQLMRSRYCGFVLSDEEYLLHTWHRSTRPAVVDFNLNQKWLGLKVKRVGNSQTSGFVEFIARYRVGGGRAGKLHEVSEFVKEDGQWLYLGAVSTDQIVRLGG